MLNIELENYCIVAWVRFPSENGFKLAKKSFFGGRKERAGGNEQGLCDIHIMSWLLSERRTKKRVRAPVEFAKVARWLRKPITASLFQTLFFPLSS